MRQRKRKTSAYRRLAEDLRKAIERGAYGDGGRTPTAAGLRKWYDVSRHTDRRAFQDLATEGPVYLRSFGTVEGLVYWTGTEMEALSLFELRTETEAARARDHPEPHQGCAGSGLPSGRYSRP